MKNNNNTIINIWRFTFMVGNIFAKNLSRVDTYEYLWYLIFKNAKKCIVKFI